MSKKKNAQKEKRAFSRFAGRIVTRKIKVNVMKKDMSKEKYKEYRRILYDSGEYDMYDVVNDCSPGASAQKMKMREKLRKFEERHGAVHVHLVKSGEDYAQYCSIVN